MPKQIRPTPGEVMKTRYSSNTPLILGPFPCTIIFGIEPVPGNPEKTRFTEHHEYSDNVVKRMEKLIK